MKKIIALSMVLCMILMTGCSTRGNEGNVTTQKRADESDITVTLGGENKAVPAKLHQGDGYSIYIPKEGYRYERDFDDGNFEEKWDSIYGDDAEIRITTHKNTTAKKAQNRFLSDNNDYVFEDLVGYPLYGAERDGDVLCFHLYENGGDVYIVSWEYPAYLADSFGTVLAKIAKTFQVEKNKL